MHGPSKLRPDLEADRRRLLQVAFEEFNETGNWPTVNGLARQLVNDMDVHEVLQGLDFPWVQIDTSTDKTLVLRVPAITLCEGSEEVCDAFGRTLQLAVAKYFGSEPTPEFTQAVLVSELQLSNLRAHQAMVLYKNENLWSSINGQAPGNWIIKVDNHVRPYRDVKTAQEYVERRYASDIQARPLNDEKPVQPKVVKPEATPLLFLSHSGSPAIVSALGEVLRNRLGPGIIVWSDADLPGGRWDENIREKLNEASALVIAGTPAILGSVYVGFEAGYVDSRLGQRNVFLLRLGIQVSQLQTRPPLSHYQSFDGSTAAGLHEFCMKLAQELGVPVLGSADYAREEAILAEAVRAEERMYPAG